MQWIKIIQNEDVWHRYFTWFPVIMKEYDDGNKKYVWLKYVDRCKAYESNYKYYYWCYREIKK